MQLLFHWRSGERAAFDSAPPDPECSPMRSTRVVFQFFLSPNKTCQHLQYPSSSNTLPMENNQSQSSHTLPSGLLGTCCLTLLWQQVRFPWQERTAPSARLSPLPSSAASLSSSNEVSRHTSCSDFTMEMGGWRQRGEGRSVNPTDTTRLGHT